jgi:hypothetical protein
MYDDRDLVRDDRLYIYLNSQEKALGKIAAKRLNMQFAQMNREILVAFWQRINSMTDEQLAAFKRPKSVSVISNCIEILH